MVCLTTTSSLSMCFSLQNMSYSPTTTSAVTPTTVHFSPFLKPLHNSSLSLSSSSSVSSFFSVSPFRPPINKPFSRLIVSAKGYKMKTHKASAKRFRVTGTGKIMRRRAGKQHLLRKKNTKRRVRLSKMLQVDRCDYNNVIGALPYLKVNRQN